MSLDFAAAMNIPAPAPPRATPNASAAPARQGPEDQDFAEHLDRAASEEKPERAAAPKNAKEDNDADVEAIEVAPAPVAPPAEAPAAPVLLQLIAPIETGAETEAPLIEAGTATAPKEAAVPPAETPPTAAPAVPAPAPASPQTETRAAKSAPATTSEPSAATDTTEEAGATAVSTAPAPDQAPPPQLAAIVQAPPPKPSGNDAKGDTGADSNKTPALRALGDTPSPQPKLAKAEAPAASGGAPQDSKVDANTEKAAPAPKDSFTALLGANASADGARTAPPPQAHTPAVQSAAPNAETTARAMAAPPQAQVGREIVRRFNGGATQFALRLDPPELGRVDVRLDVSKDHKVTAIISADTPQALSELARGARDLQQALSSAGLTLADDGLKFDLRQQQHGGAEQGGGERQEARAAREEAEAPLAPVARALGLESWRGARVDVMA